MISIDFLVFVRVECVYIWCNLVVEGIVFVICVSCEECWMYLGLCVFFCDVFNVLFCFVDE